uniref:Uncharacterized protein MANES_01G217800 n=1 Tax=Rhizophora mucronata TaxID=61149 RepID=A0A2P2K606_RHIMU
MKMRIKVLEILILGEWIFQILEIWEEWVMIPVNSMTVTMKIKRWPSLRHQMLTKQNMTLTKEELRIQKRRRKLHQAPDRLMRVSPPMTLLCPHL